MTNAQIDAKVLRLIKRSPKVGATAIAEALGARPEVVRLCLYRLKYNGLVRRRGNTRGATYTAA